MKTILQIAKEIGVSKQAVYKRYKGKLHTEVSPYVHIKDGATYILEQGESIIKADFEKNSDILNGTHTEHIGSTSEPQTERIQDVPSDTVNTLIQMLKSELEAKNKQIEELMATIKIQAESIKATQQNELAETIIPQLREGKKENFFKRIFSRSDRH